MPNRITLLSIIIPTITAIFLLGVAMFEPETYAALTNENNGFELLTAIFYITAGIILLNVARKQFKSSFYLASVYTLLLAIFFIFIGGEEESWGQWFFQYEVSDEIKAINTQNEINIHNLGVFSDFINPHMILNVFILLFGIITPILYVISSTFQRAMNYLQVSVVPVSLVGWFSIALIYERVANKITYDLTPHYEIWRNTEVMEFLFSAGILFFALYLMAEWVGEILDKNEKFNSPSYTPPTVSDDEIEKVHDGDRTGAMFYEPNTSADKTKKGYSGTLGSSCTSYAPFMLLYNEKRTSKK